MTSEDLEILIVDDDMVDAMAIQRAFRKRQIINPIVHKRDGVEGLAYLEQRKSNKPIIVLLDIHMPKMNGFEFLMALRGHEKLRDTIVFMLTTSMSDDDINKAYKSNVAGYLAKDQVGKDFEKLITMLNGYWRVVHVPNHIDGVAV